MELLCKLIPIAILQIVYLLSGMAATLLAGCVRYVLYMSVFREGKLKK
jgi:hypothetical protein